MTRGAEKTARVNKKKESKETMNVKRMCPVWTTPCGLQNAKQKPIFKDSSAAIKWWIQRFNVSLTLDPLDTRSNVHIQKILNHPTSLSTLSRAFGVALGLRPNNVPFLSFAALISDFQETVSRKETLLWDHSPMRRNFGYIWAGMKSLDLSRYVIIPTENIMLSHSELKSWCFFFLNNPSFGDEL